ncbi:MAG: hypothetical protein NPINA01_28250 [Nitrospinaceae bacterium]|nr:MAG: hypothetical protein NPINA01_28250 [Nitrospinaceae bacterium]
MVLLDKKLKSFLPRLGVLLVLLSFGFMTGLAPVLHAHEFDFDVAHDNCAPCHWVQSNQSVETSVNTLAAAPLLQFSIFFPAEFIGQPFTGNVLNRGPPLLS